MEYITQPFLRTSQDHEIGSHFCDYTQYLATACIMYYLLQCEYLYVRMNRCPKFCLCRLHQSSATAFKNRPFHHNDFTGSHFLNSFSSLSLHTLTWACGVWLNGGGYMYLSKRRKVENELAHTGMQYFEAQN